MSCIQIEVRDKPDNRFNEDVLRSVGMRTVNNSDPGRSYD
jgi:hypothetical protein